ncbi:hypothetical protein SCHPADRAFT_896504 [Schizopora paradoxa]|uniref:Uncharacterized protein n=1 Tax=Schizopora paradoxa TaxID=27342 RepID=A0A0H2R6L2_9AGAM|nr:hypothetical protein SCHPADRAFT_896504 [Schizopora paradoxa]
MTTTLPASNIVVAPPSSTTLPVAITASYSAVSTYSLDGRACEAEVHQRARDTTIAGRFAGYRTYKDIESFVVSGNAALRNYKLAEHKFAPFIVRAGALRTRLLAAVPPCDADLDVTCLEDAISFVFKLPTCSEMSVRTHTSRMPGIIYHLDIIPENELTHAVNLDLEEQLSASSDALIQADSDDLPALLEALDL